MVVDESVAAEAVLEPEMAPKPAPASAVAMPRPPGTRPTQVAAHLKRLSATPLRITNSAIRMKSGTEMSSYEPALDSGVVVSTPTIVSRPPTMYRPMQPVITREKATGVPMASSTNSRPTTRTVLIPHPPCRRSVGAPALHRRVASDSR